MHRVMLGTEYASQKNLYFTDNKWLRFSSLLVRALAFC
jgi:hypothetical protein